MFTDTPTKQAVFKEVREETNLVLTEEQLVIIENVYVNSRRASIRDVMQYRMINFLLSIFFFIIFVLLKWTFKIVVSEWFFSILTLVFAIYNLIHLWNQFMDYQATSRKVFKSFTVEEKK